MSLFLQHREFFSKPVRLRPGDDPYFILADFFHSKTNLCELKHHLHELLETALVTDAYHYEEPGRRDFIWSYMHQLEECLEAAWIVSNEYRARQNNGAAARRIPGQSGEDQVAELISYLVRMIAPERIFRLAHQSGDGEGRVVHLLIVMPVTNLKKFDTLETIIELCKYKDATIYTSIYHSAEWQSYAERGFLFYSGLCKPEFVVYESADAPPLPEPDEKAVQSAIEEAKQVFHKGQRRAAQFGRQALELAVAEQRSLALFMFQQSIELSLRSFILAITGRECRTHSVAVLNKHLSRYAPELCGFFPGGNDLEDSLLRLLERAYTDARYDPQFEVPVQYLELISNRVPLLLGAVLETFEGVVGRVGGE